MNTPGKTSKRDNRECVKRTESIRFAIAPTHDHLSRCETGTAVKVFAAPAPALPGFRPTPFLSGAGLASAGLVPSSQSAAGPGSSGSRLATRCDGRAIRDSGPRGDADVERPSFGWIEEGIASAVSSVERIDAGSGQSGTSMPFTLSQSVRSPEEMCFSTRSIRPVWSMRLNAMKGNSKPMPRPVLISLPLMEDVESYDQLLTDAMRDGRIDADEMSGLVRRWRSIKTKCTRLHGAIGYSALSLTGDGAYGDWFGRRLNEDKEAMRRKTQLRLVAANDDGPDPSGPGGMKREAA